MGPSRVLVHSFVVLVLLALAEPTSAFAQTFTGSLASGAGNLWFRPNASCVQEVDDRLYQRIDVFANAPGTYTFTATRTSGTGIMIDAFRSFPVSDCWTQRYNDGVVISASVSTVTIEVVDSGVPIVLVVSSTSTLSTGGYTVTVSGPAPVDGDCSGSGSLAPSTQAVPVGGGAFATTYTPPPGVDCSGYTITGKPAWITGLPTTGGGTSELDYMVAANQGGPRSASIRIGERTLTVNQAGTCNFGLSPTSTTMSGAGGDFGVNVLVNSGCPWTATTSTPWITIADPTGTGPGTLWFEAAANTGAARVGSIDVGGATLTVDQNEACSYTLGDAALDVPASGGTQMVSVTTQTGCPITGASDVAWITPIASGSGSGTTSFSVAVNTGAARSGNVTVGDSIVAVEQASGCTIALPVGSTTVASAGATASFLVNTGAGCGFSVESDVDWLDATPGAGDVDFTAEPSSGATRFGTITVTSTSTAASAEFTVTQSSGCVPALAAPGESRAAAGGAGSFGVTIDGGCSYTATPDVAWIHSVEVTATGVDFTVDANDGLERAGAIVVSSGGGDVSYSITQASGCAVAVSDESLEASAGGDSFEIEIETAEGCSVTYGVSDDWFGAEGPFDGVLTVWADTNDGAAREGTLTITSVEGGGSVVVTLSQPSSQGLPVITQQPAGRRARVGETFALIVQAGASGPGVVEFLWRKDGVPVGSGGNAIWLSNVTLEDAGDYDVVVSSAAGSVTSEVATVEVVPASGGCAAAPTEHASGRWLVLVGGVLALGLVGRRRRR